MQSYWIRNADITASSILDSFHDPGKARLHGKGAWMPLVQDNKQFLQIDFKDEANVSAVALQGHPNYDDWITKFALSFSFDGKAWDDFHEVRTREEGSFLKTFNYYVKPLAQTEVIMIESLEGNAFRPLIKTDFFIRMILDEFVPSPLLSALRCI